MSAVLRVVVVSVVMAVPLLGWADSEVLDTQPSTDGALTASIIGLHVRKGVMTLKVAIKNESDKVVEPVIRFADVYVIDVQGKKKYFVLKDERGSYIAGPATWNWDGGTFKESLVPEAKRLLWMKFPAPSDDATEVDVYLPGFLPFEAVEIKKR